MTRDGVVIVGGSLGGPHTAEALRTQGYTGPVTVVDAHPAPHRTSTARGSTPTVSPHRMTTSLDGDLESEKFAVAYRRDGRLTAVVGLNAPRQVLAGR